VRRAVSYAEPAPCRAPVDVRFFRRGGPCAGVSSAGLAKLSSTARGHQREGVAFSHPVQYVLRAGQKVAKGSEHVPLTAQVRAVSPALDEAMEVTRALDALPLDHRTVLLLGVVEGFTCGEIAEILGVPLGTVMSRLSRARQAMRMRLATTKVASPACVGKENS
jgi:hypothetical protein